MMFILFWIVTGIVLFVLDIASTVLSGEDVTYGYLTKGLIVYMIPVVNLVLLVLMVFLILRESGLGNRVAIKGSVWKHSKK